ncbi:formin 2, putative [Plasmodium malariae]|uniref:Formin 2, putative n=1 Tax=Plasmodium malariae TaxID=5858 RepID=A0A1D3TEV1_PLAMA|nr:formin 2, putative [Plasmodium malariae]SCP03479.1 formin 2, putative [Plasmodium malariae]
MNYKHLERNHKETKKKKNEQRSTTNEKEKDENKHGENSNYDHNDLEMKVEQNDSMSRKKRIAKDTLWNIENFKEAEENVMCSNKFAINDISDDNMNDKEKIIFDHFGNMERKKYLIGAQKRRGNDTYKNRVNDNKYNQITGLNLSNYLLVPDEIRHKYTKTYLFQISKRLLVMKKPWRLPKNVELQINNVYHLSNYIKVLERISSEYLNDPPINYYFRGLELYNKNVFANIDYLLKKVDIKKNPKNVQYTNLIKVNECYYDLSTFGKSQNTIFYQSYVIWDIHGSSLTLEQEYDSLFDSQIMDYNFGEKEYPNLKYILSICSSILFWLNFNKKDNFAIINYHRSSSFILLIFSCVMLVLDNSLSFDQIQEILYKSSKINNSDKENEEDNMKNTDISSNYFGNEYQNYSNNENSDTMFNMLCKKSGERGLCGISGNTSSSKIPNNKKYRNNDDENNCFSNVVYTNKREVSDSGHIYRFNNFINLDDSNFMDNLNKKDNIFSKKEYDKDDIDLCNKMQNHTLNLGSKSGMYDNELDNSKNKKRTKFSNSWGFGLTNRETCKNENKIKDHHFWIPFDYWKSSHKRYFFYMYELIKNKNKKIENIPFKLKSIIFSDYVVCSVSVEVYEIIYKDNKDLNLDLSSEYETDKSSEIPTEECPMDRGINEGYSVEGEGEGEEKEVEEERKQQRIHQQLLQRQRCTSYGEKESRQKMSPLDDILMDFGDTYTHCINEVREEEDKDRCFNRKISNEKGVINNRKHFYIDNNAMYSKIISCRNSQSEQEEPSNLNILNHAPSTHDDDVSFLENNKRNGKKQNINKLRDKNYYRTTKRVKNKISRASSVYNLSNCSDTYNENIEIESLHSFSVNSDINYKKNLEENKKVSNQHAHTTSGSSNHSFNLRHKMKQFVTTFSPRSFYSNSSVKSNSLVEHTRKHKNEDIQCGRTVQRGEKKGDMFFNRKTKTVDYNENKDSAYVADRCMSSHKMKNIREMSKKEEEGREEEEEEKEEISVGELGNKKNNQKKEEKKYNFLSKNRNKSKKKAENKTKASSPAKSGYEYFLKCNNLSYNIISSYEKNKKKYVTIDFTHDAEGNTKEHIISGDILILIGHKNIEKFHKGFSSSYSFHSGFLRKATSEIIHIRKDDMDINSNYECYIPDSMKLSIVLDSATKNECMKAYKKSLKMNNKIEDLKELKMFEKKKLLSSNGAENGIFNFCENECEYSASDGKNHLWRKIDSVEKMKRKKMEIQKVKDEDYKGGKTEFKREGGRGGGEEKKGVEKWRNKIMKNKENEGEKEAEDEKEKNNEKEEEEEEENEGQEKKEGEETQQIRHPHSEGLHHKRTEKNEQRHNVDINNNKKIDFNAKINYNGYSLFSEKESKIKYNTINITQLLTSLFGFKHRQDKYSLMKKQNMGPLLPVKRSYSNLIPLKDYLQRQYEVITKPSESLYNFVKYHVQKVNFSLVHYLKNITYLSNLKIYFSLKVCNNDLNKSLNFIVSIWGVKMLKRKCCTNYKTPLNKFSQYDNQFKKIKSGIYDVSIKSSSNSTKHANVLESLSEMECLSHTNVESYERINDSMSNYPEDVHNLWNEAHSVVYEDVNVKEISSSFNLEGGVLSSREWEKELKQYKVREMEIIEKSEVESKVKSEAKSEAKNEEKNKEKSEKQHDYINNKDSSEIITNIDGIKITKLEINKDYHKLRKDGSTEKKKANYVVKSEMEKYDEHKEEKIENIGNLIDDKSKINTELKIEDQISNNNEVLKKIEESKFFYAKLPSGELIKLKVKDTIDLSTHDSMPLLFIESIEDSEQLARALTVKLSEDFNKNENMISMKHKGHEDCLINDLEKLYDQTRNQKKNSIDTTLSIESESSTSFKYSTSFVDSFATSAIKFKEKEVQKEELTKADNVVSGANTPTNVSVNVGNWIELNKIDANKEEAGIMEAKLIEVKLAEGSMMEEKQIEVKEAKGTLMEHKRIEVKPTEGSMVEDKRNESKKLEGSIVEHKRIETNHAEGSECKQISDKQTKSNNVEAMLKKTKEKRPPPPLPASLQKISVPKAKIQSTPVDSEKKDGNNELGISKKCGKKMPAPPPLPALHLSKNKMGTKCKGALKKCPIKFSLKGSGKIQEKRPLGIKLHWQLLPSHKIEGTVFYEIKNEETKYNLINTKAVHKLFARVKAEKKIVKRSTEDKKKNNEEKLITVLDRTRAQNIGILLRFPISTQEIANKINTFNLENMSIDFLQKVLHILPTKEEGESIIQKLEIENIKEEKFRDVERKLIPFVYLDRCQCKIEICLFSLKYDKMINEIIKDLDIYDKAVKEVRSSVRLRALLNAVLKWGNYVNYGVSENEDLVALGFTLSSVLKLTEFKSSLDSSITSLHYITVSLCMYLPELNINCLENDLGSVLIASKMSSEAVDILLMSLDKEINYIKVQLKSSYEEMFKEKMKAILEDSESKYLNIQKRYEETKKAVHLLGIYLGEDIPKNNNLENIFIILSSIVENFTKCYKDILLNPKKFSIMLNDQNMLDQYNNIFIKKKNKTSNISKNCNTTNKSAITNEKFLIKEQSQVKAKVSKSLSFSNVKNNNNNSKSKFFQLRTQLLHDIQNRSLQKNTTSTTSNSRTSENEQPINQLSSKNALITFIKNKGELMFSENSKHLIESFTENGTGGGGRQVENISAKLREEKFFDEINENATIGGKLGESVIVGNEGSCDINTGIKTEGGVIKGKNINDNINVGDKISSNEKTNNKFVDGTNGSMRTSD